MTKTFYTRRLALKGQQLDEINRILSEAGYQQVVNIDEPGRRGFHRQRAWQVTEGVNIFYVEDSISDCAFLYAEGNDEQITLGLEPLMASQFKTWTPGQLLENLPDVNSATEENNQDILLAGVGAPNDCAPDYLERLSSLLSSRNKQVRLSAAWALSYSAWPESSEAVTSALADEADTEVRSVLQALHAGLERNQ